MSTLPPLNKTIVKVGAQSANEMYWAARIQYGSGLRISEVLNLVRSDFDLNHRILKLYNTKTGKGEIQKTSILPYDIPKLEKFLDKYGKSDPRKPTFSLQPKQVNDLTL